MEDRTHVLILDLKDDPALISRYEEYHRNVWPEILTSIRESGILSMQIYRAGNRLVMVMKVNETFSFDAKGKSDATNPRVQEWEALMWMYQQALPFAEPGQKWIPAEKIFEV